MVKRLGLLCAALISFFSTNTLEAKVIDLTKKFSKEEKKNQTVICYRGSSSYYFDLNKTSQNEIKVYKFNTERNNFVMKRYNLKDYYDFCKEGKKVIYHTSKDSFFYDLSEKEGKILNIFKGREHFFYSNGNLIKKGPVDLKLYKIFRIEENEEEIQEETLFASKKNVLYKGTEEKEIYKKEKAVFSKESFLQLSKPKKNNKIYSSLTDKLFEIYKNYSSKEYEGNLWEAWKILSGSLKYEKKIELFNELIRDSQGSENLALEEMFNLFKKHRRSNLSKRFKNFV